MGDIAEDHEERFDTFCDGCGELLLHCICEEEQARILVLEDALQKICSCYCEWYDRNPHGLGPSEVAYEMVSYARSALPRNTEGK